MTFMENQGSAFWLTNIRGKSVNSIKREVLRWAYTELGKTVQQSGKLTSLILQIPWSILQLNIGIFVQQYRNI